MVKRGMFIPLFTSVLLLGFCFIGMLYAGPDGNGEMVGDETCADCHDDLLEGFAKNAHSMSGAQDGYACESCHGPGAAHANAEDKDLIYNPATDYNAAEKNACLDCHNDSDFESMDGRAHYELANGCSDCHTVHGSKKQLLKTDKKVLCLECHSDVYAQLNLPSRHPVKEGLMECDDCHNVHGGQVAHTMGNDNELCISCHASKEGPFVFEHDPVAEDCKICHTPHGTIANNLLIESEPGLCLSCHPMHFHTQVEGFDGSFASTPYYPDRTASSTEDAWKRGMLTKCTQCHRAIHGSDRPSQGGGTHALTR